MTTITINTDMAEMVENFLVGQLGYTEATLEHVIARPDGRIVWNVAHIDDFQRNIDFELRTASGHSNLYEAETCPDLMTELRRLPSREMRELGVLAARIGNLGDTSQLESERAQAFAKKLLSQHKSLLTMIEDKS